MYIHTHTDTHDRVILKVVAAPLAETTSSDHPQCTKLDVFDADHEQDEEEEGEEEEGEEETAVATPATDDEDVMDMDE